MVKRIIIYQVMLLKNETEILLFIGLPKYWASKICGKLNKENINSGIKFKLKKQFK